MARYVRFNRCGSKRQTACGSEAIAEGQERARGLDLRRRYVRAEGAEVTRGVGDGQVGEGVQLLCALR